MKAMHELGRRAILGGAVLAMAGCATAGPQEDFFVAIRRDNAGSIAFHESLGFDQGVRLREVGRKFGRWLDVQFMQLFL